MKRPRSRLSPLPLLVADPLDRPVLETHRPAVSKAQAIVHPRPRSSLMEGIEDCMGEIGLGHTVFLG